MAFGPDGPSLFAVTEAEDGSFSLFVLPDAITLTSSSVDLSITPDPALATDTLTLSGQLSMLGSDERADQAIHLTRVNPGGSTTPLPDLTTDATGHFAATDAPGAGTFVYVATWDGDVTHRGWTTAKTIAVAKPSSSLTLKVSSTVVPYKGVVSLIAHLGAYGAATDTTVSIYATPYGGTKKLVTSGSVDADGDLSVDYPMQKRTTFTARWAGDENYENAVSSPLVVSVRVAIRDALLKFDATSGKYRLYRYASGCPTSGKGCPTYGVTVMPNHHGQWRARRRSSTPGLEGPGSASSRDPFRAFRTRWIGSV